jgi:hypothetical protein
MRFIVAEPQKDVAAYDQDQWARSLHYDEAPLGLTLDVLDTLGRWNLGWIATLSEEKRSRWGNHGERGQESIERILQLLAAHDLVHRAQIARILTAVT